MRFHFDWVVGLLFGVAFDPDEDALYLMLGVVVLGVSWRGRLK